MLTNTAFQFNKHGKPTEVLQKVMHVLKKPNGSNLLRVRMLAAPINHADLGTIAGRYSMKPPFPNAVPGNEGVGIVEEADPQCTNISPGDYVIPALQCMGTWQKYIWAEENKFIQLPLEASQLEQIIEKRSLAALATLNSNLGTAYRFLHSFVNLNPGDVVCQCSANSFLGRIVIQLAELKGLKTVNLVRKEEEKEELYALGASICLTYDECNELVVKEKLSSLPKLALCTVGGPLFQSMISIMDEKSTVIVISAINKLPFEISASEMVFKQISLRGTWISKWYNEGWERKYLHGNDKLWNERIHMLQNILEFYRDDKIILPPCEIIPFDNLNKIGNVSGKKQIIYF